MRHENWDTARHWYNAHLEKWIRAHLNLNNATYMMWSHINCCSAEINAKLSKYGMSEYSYIDPVFRRRTTLFKNIRMAIITVRMLYFVYYLMLCGDAYAVWLFHKYCIIMERNRKTAVSTYDLHTKYEMASQWKHEQQKRAKIKYIKLHLGSPAVRQTISDTGLIVFYIHIYVLMLSCLFSWDKRFGSKVS